MGALPIVSGSVFSVFEMMFFKISECEELFLFSKKKIPEK